MGRCREKEEEEEEADSAAVSWPWSAWWAGLEGRKRMLFRGNLSLTDGSLSADFPEGRKPHTYSK